MWIGLYKPTYTEWLDGNQSPYRNWATGQPDEYDRCVRLTDDGFDVKRCDDDYRYICRKNAGCYWPVAPPGFCNRGEVRYGSIGGLEYEVPSPGRMSVYQRGSLLDGLAMNLSCDTKKFHDNESTHILHNFWTSTHRGGSFPPSPLAAPVATGAWCQ